MGLDIRTSIAVKLEAFPEGINGSCQDVEKINSTAERYKDAVDGECDKNVIDHQTYIYMYKEKENIRVHMKANKKKL